MRIRLMVSSLVLWLAIGTNGLEVRLTVTDFNNLNEKLLSYMMPRMLEKLDNVHALVRMQLTKNYQLASIIKSSCAHWSLETVEMIAKLVRNEPQLQAILLRPYSIWHFPNYLPRRESSYLVRRWPISPILRCLPMISN